MNDLVSKSERQIKNNGKFMTIRNIADVLGVSYDTINRCVKRIFPNKLQHGKKAYFNEVEIALISKELKSNTAVLSHQTVEVSATVKNTTTEAEIIANYKQATEALVSMLNVKNQELQFQNDNLKIKLDESKEWYSIKRMEKLNKGQHFNWRLLKKESERMGVEIKEVFDANYGKVNAYHVSVWESLYFDTLNFGD